MKPWTEKKAIASAFGNEHVRVGERLLETGVRLRGLYAAKDFRVGDPVASYFGEVLSRKTYLDLNESDHETFEHVSEYAVEIPGRDDHLSVDRASVDEKGAHLVNHSCQPNLRWAEFERGRLLLRASRAIAAGDELTIFYGWLGVKSAIEKAPHPCHCRAPYCTGSIELSLEWIGAGENGGGTYLGGTYLGREEITRRFLADIRNDTRVHEVLLLQYPEAIHRVVGAEVQTGFDYRAFAAKLYDGARAARAMVNGLEHSARRLSEITERYLAPGRRS